MKKTVVFLSLFIFFGAVMLYSHLKGSSENYEKIADTIAAKTAENLRNKKKLILVGTGGRMMDDIKMMMMSFDYHNIATIETARNLIVDSVEQYLSKINTSEKIRPYLHNYPFTAKNIEIEIVFHNPDGSKVALDQICLASAREGEIIYYIDNPDHHTLKAIFEETYDEARKKIVN